jgi:glycosyltransferase involved in cell wall biosynthesis
MNRLLIFSDYYLPGFKAGGPIRSISNLCDSLKDEYEVYVVTRDRDLGSNEVYKGIVVEQWNDISGIKVFYVKNLNMSLIAKVIDEVNPISIHFNSIMSLNFSFIPLLYCIFTSKNRFNLILSPRGELSDGALDIKANRKSIYLFFFRLLGLHKKFTWLATSLKESVEINNQFKEPRVEIIDNLPSIKEWSKEKRRVSFKHENTLNIIFYSRVSQMKNLEYLIKLLIGSELKLNVDVWGPSEDIEYQTQCINLTKSLPKCIDFNFKGEVEFDNAYTTMKEYDLFILPTKGENFGQAIWESLASGVPVLISNLTPWRKLENQGVGWDLALEAPLDFKNVIKKVYEMNDEQHSSFRTKSRNYALAYVENSKALSKLKKIYSNKLEDI